MTEEVLTFPAPAGTTGFESPVIRAPALWKRWRWSPPGLGGAVDLRLLLFLVLFLNVKLAVKIPVLALSFVLQPAPWGIFRLRASGVPLFYPVILLLAAIEWLLFQGPGNLRYDLVAGSAILFWIACWAASIQVKLFAGQNDQETLHRTLWLFFLVNAAVSLWDLVRIDWEIKALNPYLYQGMYQKYFIKTGDFVKGLTFDTSTTNALINAFGVVYFLFRKQGWMMAVCMACLLATGSNFTNFLMLGLFAFLFVFGVDREQKGGILLCMLMGALFLGKISPQNQAYTVQTFERWQIKARQNEQPDGQPADSLRVRQAIAQLNRIRSANEHWTPKITLPTDDIHSAPFQSRADTTVEQRGLFRFVEEHKADLPMAAEPGLPRDGKVPGKLLALEQTWTFFEQHPSKIFFGNGPGNFSSKLAFKATGLGIAGSYPPRLAYIHPDFMGNNLDLYLAYFSKPKEVHSLVNSPDSVYGQLLGEYGIVGLGLFVWLYLGFFLKRRGKGPYKPALLLILVGSFLVGYWFEDLSIVVLFELLMFQKPLFT